MRIRKTCPYCNVEFIESSHYELDDFSRVIELKCGHTFVEEVLKEGFYSDIVALNGNKPYKFQVEGCEFFESSNGRCLFTYQQGLGKTVIACMIAAAHSELRPIVIVCKRSLASQWQRMLFYWTGIPAQILENGKDFALPGVSAYIISYDVTYKYAWLEDFPVKLLVIDEVQNIKNHEAKRTNGVRTIARNSECIVGLSGTPIRNNALEYFPILNLLRSEMFPTQSSFIQAETNYNSGFYGSKVIGLRNPAAFAEKTRSFVFGKTRAECLPDLPTVQRINRFCDLGKQEDAYAEAFERFAEIYDKMEDSESAFSFGSNILGIMAKMRHIVGQTKIKPALEFLEEHLREQVGITAPWDKKLVIFAHHKDIQDMLYGEAIKLCKEYGQPAPLKLTSDIKAEDRSKVIEQFRTNHDIMIASTLVAGEGLDGMQVCSKALFLEREWNPTHEEQAEGRFTRPGSEAAFIQAFYITCENTIDEYLGELVEKKRAVIEEIMRGSTQNFNQSQFLQELADVLRRKGRAQWKI